MTNYSRKRPLGGWLIIPMVIGIAFTLGLTWDEAIRKALEVPPKPPKPPKVLPFASEGVVSRPAKPPKPPKVLPLASEGVVSRPVESQGRSAELSRSPGIIVHTPKGHWSNAIRKALGDTPKDRSPISNSTWNDLTHNAQGFLLGNSAGIRVSYLSPSASRQFSKSSSIELYGIFDLKSASGGDERTQSRGRFCLEGFIDYLSMETKSYTPFPNRDTPEWLSDLTSISLGGSILYKYQERDFSVYLGGGLAYYFNEFTLPRKGRDYVWNRFKVKKADAYFQEEVEDTIGFHLRTGTEIQLSGNVFLSLAIKKTFVKPAGVRRHIYVLDKGEIDLSTFALGVGLSLWF